MTVSCNTDISGVCDCDPTLEEVLAAGKTAANNYIQFQNEGLGIYFGGGGLSTVSCGLNFDGGALQIFDDNSNVDLDIFTQTTRFYNDVSIEGNGTLSWDLVGSVVSIYRSSNNVLNIQKTSGASTPTLTCGVTTRMTTTSPIQFNQTTEKIYSSTANQLDLAAATKILATSPILECSANLKVGTTTTLNSLTYTWPASQSASQYLQTNGSGTLSWATVSTATPAWSSVLAAGNSSSGNNALMTTSDELRLRDTATRLYSNATNEVTLEATTMTNIGVAGDIQLGDGTLRVMRPNTDAKIDLGSSSFRFNDGLFAGNVKTTTAGKGFYVKEGSNAMMGTATLTAGTVVVSTTAVTANSRIYLTAQALGTVAVGQGLAVSARTAGTSFTIISTTPTDTSTIAWLIIEPS